MNLTHITSLLTGDHDFERIIAEFETVGRTRGEGGGYEAHHVEPERKDVVYLTPFEHLAIHICHARLDPTPSNRSKVMAFVRAWPGSFRRILDVPDDLRTQLISYGQGGRDPSKMLAHPNTIAALHRPNPQAAENGRKSAWKTRGKPRKTPVTWGDKISEAARNEPVFICEHCGKKVKRRANLVQHQRSAKCTRD